MTTYRSRKSETQASTYPQPYGRRIYPSPNKALILTVQLLGQASFSKSYTWKQADLLDFAAHRRPCTKTLHKQQFRKIGLILLGAIA